MVSKATTITPRIRDDILSKVGSATSKTERLDAIFQTLVEANVDWKKVSLEDMKSLMVATERVKNRLPQAYPACIVM